MTNGNEPMHAIVESENAETMSAHFTGLTKREYFAAMAMQGFASKEGSQTESGAGAAALYAVKFADALIAELNKEQS